MSQQPTQQQMQQQVPSQQPVQQQQQQQQLPAQQKQDSQISVPLINGIPFYKTRLFALISTSILFFFSLISLFSSFISIYAIWNLIFSIINLGLYGCSLYFIYNNDNRYVPQLILAEIIFFGVSWLLNIILTIVIFSFFVGFALVWTVFTLIFYAILFAPLYFYRQELLLNTPILPVQKSEMDVVNSTPPTEAPLQGIASETPAQKPTNVQNSIPIN